MRETKYEELDSRGGWTGVLRQDSVPHRKARGNQMRLSEAIRLGAMLKPQGTGAYQAFENGIVVSCALGAALDAIGIATEAQFDILDAERNALFPVCALMVCCPICPAALVSYLRDAGDVIAHLNDTHEWTREQIADWVETVERAEQPALEPATATNAVDPVLEIVAG